MRQLVKLDRRTKELSKTPAGFYRGSLAEDYDGIGQYVLVALSRTSTASSFRARVASGDFGGGRTFPAGTPVVVSSQRGNIEVFLGNIPSGCQETFSRTVVGDLGQSEFLGIPWQMAYWWNIQSELNVDGSAAVVNSVYQGNDNDKLSWLTSAQPWAMPFEAQLSLTPNVIPNPPLGISGEPFYEFGLEWDPGTLKNNNDPTQALGGTGLPHLSHEAGLMLAYSFPRTTWYLEIYDKSVNLPITDFPQDPQLTGGGVIRLSSMPNGQKIILKFRRTDPSLLDDRGAWGVYGKYWFDGDSEPTDWQMWETTTNLTSGMPASPYNFNSLWFDDFGIFGAGVSGFSTWDDIILNQCPVPDFVPSPRIQQA